MIEPTTPVMTNLKNNSLSTFLKCKCDNPETPVVKTSEVWTADDVNAGGTPK
jgi:hypothetical protein